MLTKTKKETKIKFDRQESKMLSNAISCDSKVIKRCNNYLMNTYYVNKLIQDIIPKYYSENVISEREELVADIVKDIFNMMMNEGRRGLMCSVSAY